MFDHGNIISLNLRNMLTIVLMATVGWFCLHLLARAAGGSVGVSYTGGGNYTGGLDFTDGM